MKTELVTAPATLPVTLDEFKAHIWTFYDQSSDAHMTSLIRAATSHVETITSRRLVSQKWRGYLREWPWGDDPIELPFGRATEVTRFNWLGDDAVDHVLVAGTDYLAAVAGQFPQVVPMTSWPSGALYVVDPIRIEFIAGFGAAAAVPDDLKHAILVLAAHWYENREAVIVGTTVREVPFAFDALVSPWRIRHV